MRNVRLVVSALVVVSILALNPIKANAEWRQDNNGWRYAESNSYVKGTWKLVDGIWYYFFADGYMAYNTTIDGYYVNSSGAWVSNSSSPETATSTNPNYAISSINDEWRAFYFKLESGPFSYHGAKESFFDNMTKAIGDGSLSKEDAEAQLNSMDFWKETENSSCKVGRQHIEVYETDTNNLRGLINEINNGRLFAAGTYSNSYVYYNSQTGKNRVVMLGINFITRTITSN